MSEAAPAQVTQAPADNAGASPSPSASGAAPAPARKLPRDPFDAAKTELRQMSKERKRLALVAPQQEGEQAPATGENDRMPSTQDDSDATTERDGEGEADRDEDGKEPTWAQKLRQDLAKKTEEVAKYREEQAKQTRAWERAVTQAKHRIDDVSDERDHYRGLFEQARDHLIKAGMLDELSVQLVAEQYEKRKLQRQLERGTAMQTEQGKAQLTARHTQTIQQTLGPLVKKFPELDPKKNPDAREWLELAFSKYRETGRFPENLAESARRWVAGWRAVQAPQTQQQQRAPAPRAPRPETSTLAGATNNGRTAGAKRSQLPNALTMKQLKAEIAQYRAQRQR